MEERLVRLEASVGAMQADISETKGAVRGLSEVMGRSAIDLAVVRTEVTNHVSEIKRDIAEIKSTTANRSGEMWRQAFYFLAGALVSGVVAVMNYVLQGTR